ncbi:hypothetical protein SDC9_53888 [bioreactor metagenome]|uniref:Uncharacterized protein n=1 Tax=bioreactor metagenome TaxID=1076179 RepID=A0A644WUT3_9ZZZZ
MALPLVTRAAIPTALLSEILYMSVNFMAVPEVVLKWSNTSTLASLSIFSGSSSIIIGNRCPSDDFPELIAASMFSKAVSGSVSSSDR